MKQIILDVETKKAFDEVGGYFPEKLGISFVGVIERDSLEGVGTKHRFFESDLPKLWPLLETADVIVGFNTDGFDFPSLKPYYPGNTKTFPSLDLLSRIKDSVGHRVSLDAVATSTLGVQKSGSGLDALHFYETGQLDKLADYCLRDVEITRDVYDYGRINGHIKFINKWNRLIEPKVDFNFEIKPANSTQMTLGGL